MLYSKIVFLKRVVENIPPYFPIDCESDFRTILIYNLGRETFRFDMQNKSVTKCYNEPIYFRFRVTINLLGFNTLQKYLMSRLLKWSQ